MTEMRDIYEALTAGKSANDSLSWLTRSIDGRDRVNSNRHAIDAGLAAYNRLQEQLRDGRKHIEPPEDYKHTSCYCSAPTCSPPCSFCTDPENNKED